MPTTDHITSAKRPSAQICVNAKCVHNKRGTGCTLFEGSAWLRCRKARIATKAARKGGAA